MQIELNSIFVINKSLLRNYNKFFILNIKNDIHLKNFESTNSAYKTIVIIFPGIELKSLNF